MTTLSVIGPATSVRGAIRGEGDLEILGRVEGSVVVQGEVTVGEGALVQCDVRARRVIVRGAVRGNVSADELLIVEAGGRILGDLGAPQVGIRPGGLVKGHVSTSGPLPLERPKPAVVAKAAPAPARAAAPAVRTAAAPAHVAARPVAPAHVARPAPAPRPAPPMHVAEVEPVTLPRGPARTAAVPAPPPSSPSLDADPTMHAAGDDPPPPVVPALPKGARASMRKKAGK